MTKPRTPKAKAVKPVRAWAVVDAEIRQFVFNDDSDGASIFLRRDRAKSAASFLRDAYGADSVAVVRVLITVVGK